MFYSILNVFGEQTIRIQSLKQTNKYDCVE